MGRKKSVRKTVKGKMEPDKGSKISPPHHEAISRQLEHMLNSPSFRATPMQIALLRYVVAQTLAGNADQIKAYTVATEVFGRGPDFDQSIDPVVSIQAGRLRRAMERYYLTAGKHDPIRIDIPKGGYVPMFEKRLAARTTADAIDGDKLDIRVISTWPSVLIQPLPNISGRPEFDFWGVGLATELADELSRYADIRVMTQGSGFRQLNGNFDAGSVAADTSIDYKLRGCPIGLHLPVARALGHYPDIRVATQFIGEFRCQSNAPKIEFSVPERPYKDRWPSAFYSDIRISRINWVAGRMGMLPFEHGYIAALGDVDSNGIVFAGA